MLFRALILRTSGLRWVRRAVTRSRLFRPMVSRFIAGETVAEAVSVAEGLAAQGFGVSLDLLGENVATLEEANRGLEHYLALVEAIGASPHVASINISIKLTALGLDQGDEVAEANYRKLLTAAARHDLFVRADMEASEYTERTIAMVERVFPDHPNTGTVLQSYLLRTDQDLDRLLELGCRVRLVKGAYLEPESVAYQDKSKVDSQYIDQSKRLVCEANYPAIATHDAAIITTVRGFAETKSLEKGRFEWQMLYGIRRDLQAELHHAGYPVRVYVPFGQEWYPYFTRRLAERPANLLFIAKSLFKG